MGSGEEWWRVLVEMVGGEVGGEWGCWGMVVSGEWWG